MSGEDLSGRRLGGFELVEPLGAGAFGTVWRARQLRLERDVAVKVLDPSLARDPNAARRFEREGRSAAALDHPAIVPVYEAGDEDGLYFLAMRLVDGDTLDDRMRRSGPIEPDDAADLLAPVAAALDHAHAAGFVHRDVKPSNILLEGDQVYLSDFGIAALTSELGRYTTGSIGTAEYMAPEQSRGDVDHRADLYALGCVAFQAVTGSSPFDRGDMVTTMLAHSTDEIPATGDADLDAFFAIALAKDPDARFDSAGELVDALRRIGDDEAAVGATTASASVTPPAANRSRRPIAIGVVVAIAVGLVAVFALVGGGSDDDADDGAPDETLDTPATSSVTNDDTDDPDSAGSDDQTEDPDSAVADTTVPPTTVEPAPALVDGGNVVVGTTLGFDSPNPHADLDTATVLAEWVLPVLFAVDTDLNAVPSLAAGEPSVDPDDPLTIDWTIRDDVVWSDGSAVTSADVAATYAYLSAPDTNATNLLLYSSVEAVEVVDDTSFRVLLSEPLGGYRLLFSTIHPIIQSAVWEAHLAAGGTAADFLDEGVGFAAGPYRVATNDAPGELTLLPNPAWTTDEGPRLDRVRFTPYDDAPALVDALGAGEVDIIWTDDPGPGDVNELLSIDGVDAQIAGSDLSKQLTFNTARAPFNDPVVRQAVSAAIDVASIAQTVVGGTTQQPATPLESLVFLPGQDAYQPTFGGIFDPDGAEAALDAAGWVRGDDGVRARDGVRLEFDAILSAASDDVAVALVAQSDLDTIGIEMNGIPLGFEELAVRRDSGDWDLYLQTRLFNSDPVATRLVFGIDGCPSSLPTCDGVGVNFGAFSDPEVEALLDAADLETDPAARAQLYVDIDELLAGRAAALPLFVLPAVTAFDASLTGVDIAPNRGPLASLDDWAFLAS